MNGNSTNHLESELSLVVGKLLLFIKSLVVPLKVISHEIHISFAFFMCNSLLMGFDHGTNQVLMCFRQTFRKCYDVTS